MVNTKYERKTPMAKQTKQPQSSVQKLLSDRINHYRTQLQMSYYELSYRSTVPLTTLMHIMKGSTRNPGIFTMIRICNGLGITVAEFFQAEEFANIEFDA